MEFSEYVQDFPMVYTNARSNTGSLFPLREKEQAFGGSFLHLLLAFIGFSSFTMDSNGQPADLFDFENKKNLRVCKSLVKTYNIAE